MTTYHDIPPPSAEALQRSEALTQVIRQKIRDHQGSITFASFMELALYHPEFGYYQHPEFTLGKQGDFITAPEISPLFARSFARQYLEIAKVSGETDVLELGAGTGRFALDFLMELDHRHALPQRYFIYEISPALRAKQRSLLQVARPDLLSRVEWLTALPQEFSGTVIANEVLDAIPFHCFQINIDSVSERMVTIQDDQLTWQTAAPSSPHLRHEIEILQREYALMPDYQSEIQLPAMDMVRDLCRALKKGVILFADYGYGQREYYHPQRYEGTLSCFYQHRTHNNPLCYPGLQDITTHMDFTRVIATAAANGGEFCGFTTQAGFLLANGMLEMAQADESHLSAADAFKMHQAIKVLTMPTEMGDRVKVMAIGKGFSRELQGFSMLDRSRDL